MPRLPEGFEDIQRYADRVSDSAQYPLRDARDIIRALGDENTEYEHRGQRIKLGQLKQMLPESFFPVESREDLLAKLGHLESRSRRGAQDHAPAEQRDKAPDDAGEPPRVEKSGRPGGFPGIRGHGKAQQ